MKTTILPIKSACNKYYVLYLESKPKKKKYNRYNVYLKGRGSGK